MQRRVTIYRDQKGLRSLFDGRKYDAVISEGSVKNVNYSQDMKIKVSGKKGQPLSIKNERNLYELISDIYTKAGIDELRFTDRSIKRDLRTILGHVQLDEQREAGKEVHRRVA